VRGLVLQRAILSMRERWLGRRRGERERERGREGRKRERRLREERGTLSALSLSPLLSSTPASPCFRAASLQTSVKPNLGKSISERQLAPLHQLFTPSELSPSERNPSSDLSSSLSISPSSSSGGKKRQALEYQKKRPKMSTGQNGRT